MFDRPTFVGRIAAATVPNPVLPAAATTTTPERTSRFTSAQMGLWPQANISGSNSYPTLRLTPCTRSNFGLSLSFSRR